MSKWKPRRDLLGRFSVKPSRSRVLGTRAAPAKKKSITNKQLSRKPFIKKQPTKKPLPRKPLTKKPRPRKPPTKKPLPRKRWPSKQPTKKPLAKKQLSSKQTTKKPLPLTKKQRPSKQPTKKPLAKKQLPSKQLTKKQLPLTKKQLPSKQPTKKPLAKKQLPSKQPTKKPLPLTKKQLPSKQPTKKPFAKKQLPSKQPTKKPLPLTKKQLPSKQPTKKQLPSKQPTKKPLPSKQPTKKPLPRKSLSRKPLTKKPLPRKLSSKKQAHKKQPSRKRPPPKLIAQKIKHQYPTFMAQANAAEFMSLTKLGTMQDTLEIIEPGLDMGLKSFINADGTVDIELRLRNLPDEWRTPEGMPALVGALSEAIRAMGAFPRYPGFGGAFWVSFGLRFGPKDESEIAQMASFYKRHRGLLQVAAYHTPASAVPAILNNAVVIRSLVESIWEKRNLPPLQILARIVWTPDGKRPGRFAGEGGSAK